MKTRQLFTLLLAFGLALQVQHNAAGLQPGIDMVSLPDQYASALPCKGRIHRTGFNWQRNPSQWHGDLYLFRQYHAVKLERLVVLHFHRRLPRGQRRQL